MEALGGNEGSWLCDMRSSWSQLAGLAFVLGFFGWIKGGRGGMAGGCWRKGKEIMKEMARLT